MINIAICDDEMLVREKLSKLISAYLDKKEIEYSVMTFGTGDDLINCCESSENLSIIFLDINMKGLDGIKTGLKIREWSKEVYIVFVTAYIKYSLEGYKVRPIRYLIKGDKNFEQSLQECIDVIFEDMEYGIQKIILDFREGKKELSIDKIVYVESNLHTVSFCIEKSKKKKYTMISTLNEIEERLKDYSFLRIHQSFLINLKHVNTIKAYIAVMDNGSELPIPRTKYRLVKEAYVEYMGEI